MRILDISIHALQTECDCHYAVHHGGNGISIHALQTECDYMPDDNTVINYGHFYPRTPNGVRPKRLLGNGRRVYFYPRTPNGVRR